MHVLRRDIVRKAEWLRQKEVTSPVRSVFFGGGTPSLLPTDLLRDIFDTLAKEFAFEADVEITLEANPETLTPEKLREWKKQTPINRVSLGAQSFDPKYLAALERRTTPEQVRRAAEMLLAEGYDNFNIDLIFAIPGQTCEEMERDLSIALEMRPKHLSSYQLSLKPAHPLYGALPSNDDCAVLYEKLMARLAERGFDQYEISNFSKLGFECRHNLLYWQGGDFLGIGPSAASRVFLGGRFQHRKDFSDVRKFARDVDEGTEIVFEKTSHPQTVLEAAFLELRCNEGVDVGKFSRRYGYDLEKAKKYPLFLGEGILVRNQNRLSLSHRGRLLADSVSSELVDL